MRPLFDPPITLATLAQFHREVMLPDSERVVDRFATRFAVVETEHELIKLGLARIEIRLDQMVRRLEARESLYRDLVAALRRLEEHSSHAETNLDALALVAETDQRRGEMDDSRKSLAQ